MSYQVILCNVPDLILARKIAQELLAAKLCACVNLLPQLESWYVWQDKLEQSNEVALLIKTEATYYPAIEEKIKQLHPYQVPEIIALDITQGLAEYLTWVSGSLLIT